MIDKKLFHQFLKLQDKYPDSEILAVHRYVAYTAVEMGLAELAAMTKEQHQDILTNYT